MKQPPAPIEHKDRLSDGVQSSRRSQLTVAQGIQCAVRTQRHLDRRMNRPHRASVVVIEFLATGRAVGAQEGGRRTRGLQPVID